MSAGNVETLYRLSHTQEGMLYHCLAGGAQEHGGGDGTYLVQYSCVFEQVDAELLSRAWQEVVRRHAALRTLFTWERRSRPLQVVCRQVEVVLEQQDWSHLPGEEQTRRWQSHLQRDRDRGFDLERAPLMRLCLLRLDPRRSRFLWSFHHLLLDGWSMMLLMREVSTCYAALRAGHPPVLPPVAGYGEFIAWLDTRDGSGDEAFWREHLRGFRHASTLDLPHLDGAATRSAAVCKRVLDADCMTALVGQARAERLTVGTLVLAAWALVLGRHGNGDDVMFGVTLAGRPVELPGAQRIAGLFIGTVPLRVRLRDGAVVKDWLAEVQRQQQAVLAHQYTPLVEIKRCSELPATTPLFESMVGYQNVPLDDAPAGSGAALRPGEERYVEYSHYPLALLATPAETLSLQLVYDPSRFGHAAVQRLLDKVAGILEAMSVSLAGPVRSLPVLTPAELALVTPPADANAVDFGTPRCIHALIEEQARRTPKAVAVIDEHGTLDYAGLWDAARRLALRLTASGVSRDLPVPVLVGRQRGAIIAMLAVLESGGAYTPLDPAWPAERIARLLEELGRGRPLAAVLCEQPALARLGEHAAIAITVGTADSGGVTHEAPSSPSRDVDQLAYIIHTSGSTGAPRGVMVSHANLFNSVRAREVFYRAAPRVFLLLSPLTADSSIAGLFWTLCTGGALLLPGHRAEQQADTLGELVSRHRASHTLCLPSLYRTLLQTVPGDRLASLETVIVAGEACSPEVVATHHRVLPRACLYNEYGPSEATVWATATALGPDAGHGPVSLGRPIANTRVYVLDESLRPAPIGVAGELCIAGANVARGYHGDPERTTQRFVADPFDKGARLYRTGDRVRLHRDGTMEFLGRVDDQLKVRGHRVEPQEIEAVLNSHPAVLESAVGLAARGAVGAPGSDCESLARDLGSLDAALVENLLAEVEALSPADVDARLARTPRLADRHGTTSR